MLPTLRIPRRLHAWVEDTSMIKLFRSPNVLAPYIEFHSEHQVIVQAEMYIESEDGWYGVEQRSTGAVPVILVF